MTLEIWGTESHRRGSSAGLQAPAFLRLDLGDRYSYSYVVVKTRSFRTLRARHRFSSPFASPHTRSCGGQGRRQNLRETKELPGRTGN